MLGLLIAVATLAAWPVSHIDLAAPGLSVSWRAALHEAASLGLVHGRDVLFTYGPLGFLGLPEFFDARTGTMAVVATTLLSAAFVVTMTFLVHSRVGLVATVLAVILAARLVAILDPMFGPVIVVLAWASFLVYRGSPSPATALTIVGAAAVGGVVVLMKFNAGVSIFAIVAAMLVATAPRRPWLVPLALLSVAGSVVGTWLIAGQEVGALGPFLAGSWDLASGYSAAMALPVPLWQLPAALVVAAYSLLFVYRSSRDVEILHRVGLFGAVLVVLFFGWKHGVIRQGLDGFFAEAALIVLVAVDWSRVRKAAAPLALGIPLAFLMLASVASLPPLGLFDAPGSAATAIAQLQTALQPGAADAAALGLRESLRSGYGISPAVVAQVAGRRTHIQGWETGVAIAYPEISWQPAPIFQAYAAFTTSLDERNAVVLEADDGPERILRQRPRGIDQRYWLFEGPAANLVIFCRYYETAVTNRWEVVARGPDRCGEEQVISTVTAAEGERVPVPALDAPSMLIGVRINGVATGITDAIRSALYRGSIWNVDLDERHYRLVPGTASGPLLLGTNADLGYEYGYGIARTVGQIAVDDEDEGTTSVLTYTFFRIPVMPGASTGGS